MGGEDAGSGRLWPDTALARVLASGGFAVTAEVSPPRGPDAEAVRKKARALRGWVHAANVTDNQRAVGRMSPLAASVLLLEEGVEPVLQLTTRDRNRLALLSELLGAAALGVGNLLCLTGDPIEVGEYPGARAVHDVTSLELVGLADSLRRGRFPSGGEIRPRPQFLVGAAENPVADRSGGLRLQAKLSMGADFIQTQIVYDLPRFRRWLREVEERGLLEKARILVGVTPLKSVRMARFLAESVPGVVVPEDVVRRMEGARDERKEGLRIAIEIILELRSLPVSGVHVMAVGWEEAVPEVLEGAGLGRAGPEASPPS